MGLRLGLEKLGAWEKVELGSLFKERDKFKIQYQCESHAAPPQGYPTHKGAPTMREMAKSKQCDPTPAPRKPTAAHSVQTEGEASCPPQLTVGGTAGLPVQRAAHAKKETIACLLPKSPK